MVLEQVIKASWTLRSLRSGPLGHLMDSFCDWLLSQGFTRNTIRRHLGIISHLNEHLNDHISIPVTLMTAKDIEGFQATYFSRCRCRGRLEVHLRQVGYSVSRFTQFLGQQGLFDPHISHRDYEPVVNAYLSWMHEYQSASFGTLEVRRNSLCQFLDWLDQHTMVQDISRLTPESVETFFIKYSQSAGCAARRSMQSALRTFFRYCLHQGMIHHRLDLAVPPLRTYKLSRVPRGLSDAQALHVLDTVDRRTHVGRRDYALLQLLYTYGVRGGQVRALRLKDIRWAEDKIFFKALKNGKDSLLPLTEEVGESLVDYLQKSRPRFFFPEVFLTSRAPYHPLVSSGSLSAIVRSRLCDAGIKSRHNGSHVFRHYAECRIMPSNIVESFISSIKNTHIMLDYSA